MKDINVGDRILNYGHGKHFALTLKWLTIVRVTEKMIYFGSGRSVDYVSEINKSDARIYDMGDVRKMESLPLLPDVFICNGSDQDLDFIGTRLREAIDIDRIKVIHQANRKYEMSMKSLRTFVGDNQ